MQIEQLEYVIEVAKERTISNASKNLHVTQSAISQSISSLEEELGVTLFNRSRTGSIPTEEGRKVIEKGYEILKIIQELKEDLQLDKETIKGELKLASSPTFMTYLLNPLAKYKEDYPPVEIEMKEQETQEVINSVKKHRIDIGIIANHNGLKDLTEDLDFKPFTLLKGEMQVYVNKNSPLAIYDTITPQQLINQTIVMYNGDYVKWFVNDFVERIGPLKVLFSSNNTDVIRKAVLNNLAITFSPNWYIQNSEIQYKDRIKMIRITNHDPSKIIYGMVYSKKKVLPAAAVKFIQYLEVSFQTEDLNTKAR
jgi:DNA-binding transcriptional LysR family regulator